LDENVNRDYRLPLEMKWRGVRLANMHISIPLRLKLTGGRRERSCGDHEIFKREGR
jgi:hypothetical protein